MTALFVLLVVLLALKLTGAVAMAWWVVALPVLVPVGLFVVVALLATALKRGVGL
jgi:hypothetical protein